MNALFEDTAIRESLVGASRCMEVVRDFDLLFGANLAARASPEELAVDGAGSRLESDAQDFVEFIADILATRGLRRPALDPRDTHWGHTVQ